MRASTVAYNKAIDAINALSAKFQIDMIYDDGTEHALVKGDRWVYHENYFICAYESNYKKHSSLVRLLPGGYVKRHYHNNLDEKIDVLDGEISYKVYNDHKGKKLLKEGIMKRGDQLTIVKNNAHYVFTPVSKSALLKVTFYE